MSLDPSVWEALTRDRLSASTCTIMDVQDGRKYKELEMFTSVGNLTLTANCDGIQLFKSSSVSMWPVWVVINELPIKMR